MSEPKETKQLREDVKLEMAMEAEIWSLFANNQVPIAVGMGTLFIALVRGATALGMGLPAIQEGVALAHDGVLKQMKLLAEKNEKNPNLN